MKITDIKTRKYNLELVEPFSIALGTIEKVENVLVEIETDEGFIGIGEAAPTPFVTYETPGGIITLIEKYFKNLLIGEDPRNIERLVTKMDQVIKGNSCAKAAIDIALFDLVARIYDAPLFQVLGGSKSSFNSDCTISIGEPKEVEKKARTIINQGYSILKIKVGLDEKKEIAGIKRLRDSLGPRVKIRLDANQGWNPKQALSIIEKLDKFDIELIEQPVPKEDFPGLAFIRSRTNIPIMADESLYSPQDALRLVQMEAVDLFNIKLMKSGGLLKAKKIAAIGEAAGINCIVGCMMESRVALSAAAHLVAAVPNITGADLDAQNALRTDPVIGGVEFKGGEILLPLSPGLGIMKIET